MRDVFKYQHELTAFVKNTLKTILPNPIFRTVRELRVKNNLKGYRNLSTQEIFLKTYESGIWGTSGDQSNPFFSGTGSHDGTVVSTYVHAVQDFLSTFDKKQNVVDLGCGDFFVGSIVRKFCGNYIACDVVQKLIEFNKQQYKSLNVDFRALDITSEDLPSGDIVFIRQVLQHLSNEQISCVLPKLPEKYKYLVLTEHLPGAADFEHNLDKPAGPDIRTGIGSGIVITSSPFNIKAKNERKLCQVAESGGIIVTNLYQLSE
jgi:SAM-dependent methyltransferase